MLLTVEYVQNSEGLSQCLFFPRRVRDSRVSCDWSSDVFSYDLEHTSELQAYEISCDWSSDVCSRSEEHTSELQSHDNLVCRLLLENKTTFRKHRPGRARDAHGSHRRPPPTAS